MTDEAVGEGEAIAEPIPAFARLSTDFGRILWRCTTRITVEGMESVPRTGPLIIATNHSSNADALLIAPWFLPVLKRPVHWLAKQEALDWPVLGWFLAANGAFGIRRGGADIEAFRAARQVLDEGRVLGLFPEGTRSADGKLQPAKEGATLLAIRTGALVLPVGIAGSHTFWPKGSMLLRPGARIAVKVGEPFKLEAPGRGMDRHRALQAATEDLMARIAALLPPEQRGAYAEAAERRAQAAARSVAAAVGGASGATGTSGRE